MTFKGSPTFRLGVADASVTPTEGPLSSLSWAIGCDGAVTYGSTDEIIGKVDLHPDESSLDEGDSSRTGKASSFLLRVDLDKSTVSLFPTPSNSGKSDLGSALSSVPLSMNTGGSPSPSTPVSATARQSFVLFTEVRLQLCCDLRF